MHSEGNPLDLTERVLRWCHDAYTGPDGLIAVGRSMHLEVAPPSKKITVLLLGNHSAGKSTFINWYIGENIQKAGIAVETQGFTLITHGKRRDTLLCEAALRVEPRFESLCGLQGLRAFFSMEVSTSTQRSFAVLTFVDTPGLVDGNVIYPYDVTAALMELGHMADLVFVFLDPIGQALCRRTVDVVKGLGQARHQSLTFCLSKADEASSPIDRQKVLTQIVQTLCTNANVNQQGFEIKCIYVPGVRASVAGDTGNQIEELCDEIDRSITLSVQRTLTQLDRDCRRLLAQLLLETDRYKLRYSLTGTGILAISIISLLVIFTNEGDAFSYALGTNAVLMAEGTAVVGIAIFAYLSNAANALMWLRRYRLAKMVRTVHRAIQLKDELYDAYLGHL